MIAITAGMIFCGVKSSFFSSFMYSPPIEFFKLVIYFTRCALFCKIISCVATHLDFLVLIRKNVFDFDCSPSLAQSHWHHDVEFIAVIEGSILYNVNGEIIRMCAGEGLRVQKPSDKNSAVHQENIGRENTQIGYQDLWVHLETENCNCMLKLQLYITKLQLLVR